MLVAVGTASSLALVGIITFVFPSPHLEDCFFFRYHGSQDYSVMLAVRVYELLLLRDSDPRYYMRPNALKGCIG
jgi:hypothetical protein